MKIPLINLKAQYLSIKEDIDNTINSVLSECAFIGGKYVTEFESNFAEFCGASNCVGVGNGTDALFVTLKALGIGAGDEVIVPAYTFVATSEAVTMSGAKVVFADCKDDTFNIDTQDIEKKITKKTKAIIPVHLYGMPADMVNINEVAKKNNLKVIEDAAQAHGACLNGVRTGAMSDAACFSFYPGKNLGAYGDGGAVVTSDDALAKKIRMFSNHGRKDKYSHEFEGVNSRLDALQAAVLNVKLPHLNDWTKRRREVAARYSEAFGDLVTKQYIPDGVDHAYHLYVIRVKEREGIINHLEDKGISTGMHYPIPLPFLLAYAYMGHKEEDFPVAHKLSQEIMSLPICGSIIDNEVDYVISNFVDALKKYT